MYQSDDPTCVTTRPAATAAGTPGWFADGPPGTIVRGEWLNMIQAELDNILTAAGITPSKTASNQVVTAILDLIAANADAAGAAAAAALASLAKSANLSDLGSLSTALGNLGFAISYSGAKGHINLPLGLKINFDFTVTLSTGAGDAVTFDSAYTTILFGVVALDTGNGCHSLGWVRNTGAGALTGFQGWGRNPGTGATTTTSYGYIALGI